MLALTSDSLETKMNGSETANRQKKDIWDIIKVVAGSVAVPLVVGVFAFKVNESIREREVRVRMVELAVDVLKTPSSAVPSPTEVELREWASRTVNLYSGAPLTVQRPSGAAVPLSSKATTASFAGYAHITIKTQPAGAQVWLTPGDYPEVSIPAPRVTPVEMNLLASSYTVHFKLGTIEKKVGIFVAYNTENMVSERLK